MTPDARILHAIFLPFRVLVNVLFLALVGVMSLVTLPFFLVWGLVAGTWFHARLMFLYGGWSRLRILYAPLAGLLGDGLLGWGTWMTSVMFAEIASWIVPLNHAFASVRRDRDAAVHHAESALDLDDGAAQPDADDSWRDQRYAPIRIPQQRTGS